LSNKGIICIWFLFHTSPPPPLQPVLAGKPEDFLAGEGRLIERGLSAPSLKSLPLSNMSKKGNLINRV
jgi:hypothetical protein